MSFLCANWARRREGSLAEIFQKDLGDMPRSLAARHHRSQLITFTLLSWAYLSLYYLTKNMNDFAQHRGVLIRLPLLCATTVPSCTIAVENHF